MSTFIQTNALPHDDLSYFKEERTQTLLQVQELYTSALHYYNGHDLECAEKGFVQVLKPFLSKPAMQSVYVRVGDFKLELLDSMYKLGNIYLSSTQYLDNYSKSAAIFQYCDAFAKKYEIQNYKVGDFEINFLHEAYAVEQKFLSTIGRSDTNEAEAGRVVDQQVGKYVEYKKSLESIRSIVAEKLELIAEWPIDLISARAKVVEETYKESTRFFVNNDANRDTNPGLIQRLLKRCVEQLGQPPEGCEHAVIALVHLQEGK